MEIFNASMKEMADTFLHPGYMSAYAEVTAPVEMTAAIIPVEKEPVLQLDMSQALRLTEALRENAVLAQETPPPTPGDPGLSWPALIVIVVAMAVAERLARSVKRMRRLSRPILAFSMVSLVLAAACGRETATPQPPPAAPEPDEARAGPVPQPTAPFERPRDATVAIMHGLIADALACAQADSITSLDEISSQVGLPFTTKTPGMRWAIANYTDDGWGRPFRFEPLTKAQFKVTSAGEDAAFGTEDDLSIEVRRPGEHDWPSKLHGFFLRRERKDVGVAFHRCGPSKPRRVAVQPTARGLHGDTLHGVLSEERIPDNKLRAIKTRLEQVAGEAERDALVLLVFRPQDMGRPVLRKVHVPIF